MSDYITIYPKPGSPYSARGGLMIPREVANVLFLEDGQLCDGGLFQVARGASIYNLNGRSQQELAKQEPDNGVTENGKTSDGV